MRSLPAKAGNAAYTGTFLAITKMKKEQIEIEIDIANIPNNSLKLIGSTIKFVEFFYHNTINQNEYKETPLPTEEFSFIISEGNNLSVDDLRNQSYNWLSKKALEDFILGLNLCLVEANKLKRISELADETKDNPTRTEEELNEEIVKIDKKVNTMNFPTLISNLEEWINILPIPYKSEIESINKVRACFAHRNGKVNEQKDINDKINKKLKLQWVEFATEIQLPDNTWKKLSFGIRENGVDVKKIRTSPIRKEISFSVGDEIEIDINTLDGIGLTCIKFTQFVFEEIIIKKIKTARNKV